MIPGENDDAEKFRETVIWIRDNLGKDISLHINRYFPCHKLKNPPTPVEKIKELYQIAGEILNNVYMGNV